MTPPAPQQPDAPPAHALRLVRALTAGAFIVILNETIMSNAIPVMIESFGITPSTAQWLSTAFMLTMAVVIPTTGWILGRIGVRGSLILAMGLFCLGTAIATVAPVFGVLVFARVLQATGTAVMMPLLMTTLMNVIPPRFRGQVMGSVSLAISVAPATGPVISGLILQWLSWHWIFGLVLPVALVIAVVSVRMLPKDAGTTTGGVDVIGVLLSALGFGGLVWGLAGIGEGAAAGHGPAVPPWLCLLVGGIGVALLVWRQISLRAAGKEPLLDMTTFRVRSFTVSVLVMTIAFGAFLGMMIVLPLLLQSARGTSVLVAGLVLLPAGLFMGVLGPVVGRWYDVRGVRPLVVPGAALTTLCLAALAWLVPVAPIPVIGVVVAFVGVGLALMFTPLFTSSLAELPPALYPHGSALLSTLQQVGGAAGSAALISVLSWGAALGDVPDLARGGRYALLVAAALGLVTLAVTPLLPKGAPSASGHGPAH